MKKQIRNKLKKDSSRSDNFLSSYSCSKFEKCSFEKNAFKDKSTDLSLYFFLLSFCFFFLNYGIVITFFF